MFIIGATGVYVDNVPILINDRKMISKSLVNAILRLYSQKTFSKNLTIINLGPIL
jgi:hypothetical protein